MAILKIPNVREKYCDEDAILDLLRYCQNNEKTGGYIGGWSINPQNAYQEMSVFSKLANQDKGKRLRHFIVAFPPEIMSDRMVLYKVAKEITKFFANEYQVVFALHFDRPWKHIHIVLSTVNYRTLRKYPNDRKSYLEFKQHINSVLRRNKIKDYVQYVSNDIIDDNY